MLYVPHVVEEQFTVAHLAIGERIGICNPGFRHSRHHGIQLFAAVLEVAEQLLALARSDREDTVGGFEAVDLAAALDAAKFPETAGTIAGDDTVLIITPDKKSRESLQKKIESLVNRRS